MQVRWFNHFLKGIYTGLHNEAPVCLFEMGIKIRDDQILTGLTQVSYF